MSNTNRISTKTMIQIAMLSAVATVIYYLDFPVPLMPGFIKMDLSNVVSLFAGFTTGPVGGLIVCLIKNIIQVAIKGFGTTMGIGNIFDFVTSAVFTLTASLIYRKNRTKKGAVIGCVVGTIVFTAISLPLNYFIVYPIYATAFGGMEAILGAYQAIFPGTKNLFGALCIFNVPFTLVKGIICAAITILIYKPLITVLRKAHLAEKRAS
ncbi:MAG: ECF transporter S component [Oscillospiraceae bacterium]|nr:ECF transporter S component [Oscillospiraceae bacterium]